MFDRESAGLDESVARSAPASCSTDLIDGNPGDEMGWFWSIDELPDDAACRPPGAGAGAARVPGSVQELARPALPGQEPGRAGTSKLGVFDDMLAIRRKAYRRTAAAGPRQRRSGRGHRGDEQAPRQLAAEIAKAEPAATAPPSPMRRRDLLAAGRALRSALERPAPKRKSPPCATGSASPPACCRGNSPRNSPIASGGAEGAAAHRRRAGRRSGATPSSPRRKGGTRPLRALRPADRRTHATAQRHDPARRGAEPRAAEGGAGRRRRRAHPPAGAAGRYTTQARFAVAQLYDRAYANKEPERAAAKP